MIITLENKLHGTAVNLRSRGGKLNPSQMRRAERALCGMVDCSCHSPAASIDDEAVILEEKQDGSFEIVGLADEEMYDKAHVSEARAYGWGSEPWKGVSGLTELEKYLINSGSLVMIENCPPAGGSRGGTTLRKVIEANGRFYHRVPSDEEIAQYENR